MRYEDMEYMNFRNILDSISNLREPTRANIAKHLELSRTTVSNVVNSLISYGIVEESEPTKASRGRPGLIIRYAESAPKIIGAAFTSNAWCFVITSMEGKILEEYTTPEVETLTQETLISTLVAGLRFILSKKYNFLPAVGLGLPGVIDTDNGDIILANDLMWHERVPIKKVVEKELNLKVYTINRYTASGVAEYWYVHGGNEKNLIYIGIGSGIRSAIFINGELLEGASYSAGRIAHLVVEPDGEKCDCGKRGCLLSSANDKVLLRRVIKYRGEEKYRESLLAALPAGDITTESIVKLADGGDRLAMQAMDDIALPVAKAIDMLYDILNPSKLIIGGPIGYASDYFVERVKAHYEALFSDKSSTLRIEKGQLKESGAALGAATLVIREKAELLYRRQPSAGIL